MTLLNFIAAVNYAVRGTDDDTPTIGDDDWVYWVVTANRKKNEMYDDVSQDWASAWEERSLGTIAVAAAPSFNLATDFIAPSDKVTIVVTGTPNQYTDIDVCKPQERDRTVREVYVSGRNPQVLHFTNAIVTGETIVGGTLYMPGYYRPDDIDVTDDADVIPVDDPNWLVMATAAQIAFNDLTYEDKFGDLNGQANLLWKKMAKRNRRGTHGKARVSKTSVKRITGFRR